MVHREPVKSNHGWWTLRREAVTAVYPLPSIKLVDMRARD